MNNIADNNNITDSNTLNGIDIGDFDNNGFTPCFTGANMLNKNNIQQPRKKHCIDNSNEMSSSEVLTFFSSLFDSRPTLTDNSDSKIFGYERKIAANQYNKTAKNVVTDINEFVADALNL